MIFLQLAVCADDGQSYSRSLRRRAQQSRGRTRCARAALTATDPALLRARHQGTLRALFGCTNGDHCEALDLTLDIRIEAILNSWLQSPDAAIKYAAHHHDGVGGVSPFA